MNVTGAPSARFSHSAVYTGSEMIVWGGVYVDPGSSSTPNGYHYELRSGGRFDPLADAWSSLTTTNAPSARFGHSLVWTGAEMIVWGGVEVDPGSSSTPSGYYTELQSGARFSP